MKLHKIQTSESLIIGAFLAISGGFLDAYTYLVRGGVFANAQTGNLAYLGIYLAKQDWLKARFYLVPILSFALGIYLAQLIRKYMQSNSSLHWRQLILLIEIVILIAVSFVPVGELNVCVNIAISFVCALQGETFKKMHGKPFATTMCTGNLRSATEHLYQAIEMKNIQSFKISFEYFGIIMFFVLGAFLGGICTKFIDITATFIPAILLLIAFIIMLKNKIVV